MASNSPKQNSNQPGGWYFLWSKRSTNQDTTAVFLLTHSQMFIMTRGVLVTWSVCSQAKESECWLADRRSENLGKSTRAVSNGTCMSQTPRLDGCQINNYSKNNPKLRIFLINWDSFCVNLILWIRFCLDTQFVKCGQV